MFRLTCFCAISHVCLSILFSQENASHKNYFYNGKDFGSEAMFNPLSSIINSGFDILQSATHSRNLSTIKFGTGAKNLWENLKDPIPQINKFGWERFISQEIFPLSFTIDKAQYFPNYTLHLIGGGMEYRAMNEWYEYHHVPFAPLFTALSFATAHFVNEAVENDAYVGPNVDPIADMYVFDLGGALLFSSDAVCEFFSKQVQLTDWSGQVSYNPRFNTIENNGQNFVMKIPIPYLDRTKIFYYFGDSGLLGLSFLQKDNTCFSAGAGLVAKALREVDNRNGARTISLELGWIAGLFYDKDNSLLTSLIVSDRINEKVKLNIYPGVFHVGEISPGMFASIGNGNQFIAGITVRYSPVGIAYRNSE